MKIVDFSHFDGLPERDRLEAISLMGDGIDINGRNEFGIAVGDRLYHIAEVQGAASARFATLLAFELGSVDRSLVALPADPTIWEADAREFQVQAGHLARPGLNPIATLRELRRTSGEAPLSAMIGRTGIALLCREHGSWVLAHCRFEVLRNGGLFTPGAAPELLDFTDHGFSDADIASALRMVDAEAPDSGMLPPETLEVGTAYYTALLCIERANTIARHAPDLDAAAAASHNVVTPQR